MQKKNLSIIFYSGGKQRHTYGTQPLKTTHPQYTNNHNTQKGPAEENTLRAWVFPVDRYHAIIKKPDFGQQPLCIVPQSALAVFCQLYSTTLTLQLTARQVLTNND